MNEKENNLEMQIPKPTLTLDPFEKAEGDVPVPETNQEEVRLTEEEQKMVDQFADQIELTNSNMIMQYGAAAQKKIADFSETALSNVKSKDLGEIGEMLSGMVTELKSFDVDEEDKGIFNFFKKKVNKITALRTRYASAEANIDKICNSLEAHQVQLMKDVAMLDRLYEINKTYFKELSMYILAGKKKLNEVRTQEIPQLVAQSEKSGLPEDVQAANDMASMADRFEKKIYDLELTRTISLQMAPQIRLVQNNDVQMAEKIQSSLVNTIPLWKSQMVLALGIEHSNQAAQAQREITEMTNQMLRKNAEKLKTATVATAKEAERGIVDIETLKHTNETLISTFDEVIKIQEEGREKRRDAEIEMQRIEAELKQKMLEIHR